MRQPYSFMSTPNNRFEKLFIVILFVFRVPERLWRLQMNTIIWNIASESLNLLSLVASSNALKSVKIPHHKFHIQDFNPLSESFVHNSSKSCLKGIFLIYFLS